MRDDDVLQRHHQPDRGEILVRVERHFLNGRTYDEDANVAEADGVAIGFGVLENFQRDQAVSASAIINNDLLAECGAQLWLQDAPNQIGGTTGRIADNEAYGFRR